MKLFVSWSGGKDSALAAHRARLQGHQIADLLNCVAEDGSRTRSHGLPAEVIGLQAQAMGIPLIQVCATGHFRESPRFYRRKRRERRETVITHVPTEVARRGPSASGRPSPTGGASAHSWCVFVVSHGAKRSGVSACADRGLRRLKRAFGQRSAFAARGRVGAGRRPAQRAQGG